MNTLKTFLCHNSEDKPFIREIAINLNKRGVPVWLDEWELRPGDMWQDVLESQIEAISTVLICVGKSGIGPWQDFETKAFLSEFIKRKCRLIPVLLEGCPQSPKLPVFLRGFHWVDMRCTIPDPFSQLYFGITGSHL